MTDVSDIRISHESYISLHVQLHNRLRHLILSGRWSHGTRIPSENQLTHHLNISRSTVRLAFQQAEVEGLINRIPGKGTFVTYEPAHSAQPLLIAFVTNGFDSDHQRILLHGAESVIHENVFRLVFINVEDNQAEIEVLHNLEHDQVAGVLLWPRPDYTQPHVAKQYHSVQIPMVMMDRPVPGLDCDCVTSENYTGALAVMHHLLELGHENIAFISHYNIAVPTVQERYQAYQDAMIDAGLEPFTPWTLDPELGEVSASQVLRLFSDTDHAVFTDFAAFFEKANRPITAIFGVHDQIAMFSLRAVQTLNMRVPQDISVTGFDDTDVAAYLEVPLTTVAQDRFLMGKRAAQRLIDRINGDTSPPVIERIPTRLRVRDSTSIPAIPERG